MTRKQHTFSENGLTVLELIIILAAIAVVVLISVPGSSMLMGKYNMGKTTEDLMESLQTARYEAMRRHSIVRVCPSSTGRFCRRDGDWSQGWLIFSDGNGDGVVQDIELLDAYDAPPATILIIPEGAVQNMASFDVSGLAEDPESQGGVYHLCDLRGNIKSRLVNINNDGWIEMIPGESKGCQSG